MKCFYHFWPQKSEKNPKISTNSWCCLHIGCIKILSRPSLEGLLLSTGTRMCLKCSFSEQILPPCKFMILPAADIKLAKRKNAHFHLIEISVWCVCFGKINHIYLCLGGSSHWTHTTEPTGWLVNAFRHTFGFTFVSLIVYLSIFSAQQGLKNTT